MQSPNDRFDDEFLAFIGQGQLRIARDAASGKVLGLHARSWRMTRAQSVEWVPASGNGTVLSHVVFHRQFAKDFPVPYTVALVALEEGPRLLARLAGAAGAAPQAGMTVKASFDGTGLIFRAAPS